MATPRCPRCGAPHEFEQPDPIARCAWCGGLLASAHLPPLPLVARPRLDASQAKERVLREASPQGGVRHPGAPRLVYYPFAIEPSSRRPYRPLSALPPALADGWRSAGVDLVRELEDEHAKESERAQGAPPPAPINETRVPISLPLPASGVTTVHYPFWRVPLSGEGEESAAWVDAIDGQVILPADLAEDARHARAGDARDQGRLALWMLAAGGLAALVLPFPMSLAPIALAGVAVWNGWIRA